MIAKDSANNAEVTLATQIEGETTGYGVLATGGYEASNKTASAVNSTPDFQHISHGYNGQVRGDKVLVSTYKALYSYLYDKM